MRVIFEAFDGTRFADEDECRLYELKHEAKKVEKNMILLDMYGRVITEPFSEINFNEVFTIAIGNQKAAEFLENYFNEINMDKPQNGFKENRWIVISQSCGTFEEFNGIGYN